MPVFDKGKFVPLLSVGGPAYERYTKKKALRVNGPLHKQAAFYYGKTAQEVAKELAICREHFGLNISDTVRVALRLTSVAIVRNKANVELPK